MIHVLATMKKTLFLAYGLLCCLTLAAQPDTLKEPQKNHQFSINASHWTRGELRAGGLPNKKGDDLAVFVMSSTMLQFDYQYKGLEFMFAPKHVGIWGSSGSGGIILEEGWFSLRHKNGLFLKLGRQKFAYDDQRIIGSDDWVMVPARHDALKAGWESGKLMQTLWYHFDPLPQLGASLLFNNTGMQYVNTKTTDPSLIVDRTLYQQLFGVYIDWHPGPFSIQGSYYRQAGRSENDLPIHAWMASGEADWNVNDKIRLNTGYFYMSGDPQFYVPPEGQIGMAQKKEIRGFNPIFGSHHKFYGAMDFFYVSTYYGGNTPGLQDAHAGIRWTPVKSLQIDAGYHYLATCVDLNVEGYTRSLGHELESAITWNIVKDVSLQAGYTYMHGTETMSILKRSSDERNNRLHWGWIMISVTPEFFKFKF